MAGQHAQIVLELGYLCDDVWRKALVRRTGLTDRHLSFVAHRVVWRPGRIVEAVSKLDELTVALPPPGGSVCQALLTFIGGARLQYQSGFSGGNQPDALGFAATDMLSEAEPLPYKSLTGVSR